MIWLKFDSIFINFKWNKQVFSNLWMKNVKLIQFSFCFRNAYEHDSFKPKLKATESINCSWCWTSSSCTAPVGHFTYFFSLGDGASLDLTPELNLSVFSIYKAFRTIVAFDALNACLAGDIWNSTRYSTYFNVNSAF